MWCVNPHITNKMLVCVNSKHGHVNDWTHYLVNQYNQYVGHVGSNFLSIQSSL
jgi:hypothetical protein